MQLLFPYSLWLRPCMVQQQKDFVLGDLKVISSFLLLEMLPSSGKRQCWLICAQPSAVLAG